MADASGDLRLPLARLVGYSPGSSTTGWHPLPVVSEHPTVGVDGNPFLAVPFFCL